MDANDGTRLEPEMELEAELERLLAVEPSAELLARVRTQLTAEPTPSAWLSSWQFIAAGTVALAAVALLLGFLQVPRPPRTAATVEPAAPAIPAPSAIEREPTGSIKPRRDDRLAIDGERPTRGQDRVAERKVPRVAEAPVVIAPDEAAGMRVLIAGVRDGRIDSKLLGGFFSDAAHNERLDPVSIEEIVIPPTEPLTPVYGGQQ